jgi:HNH endonuclease
VIYGIPVDRVVGALSTKLLIGDGCWEWGGRRNSSTGYVTLDVSVNNKYKHGLLHRVVYELFNGPIPKGLVVDHTCSNRICANPSHLEAIPQGENVQRSHDRRLVCRNGHLKSEVGQYIGTRNGRRRRQCKACARIHNAKRRVKPVKDALLPVAQQDLGPSATVKVTIKKTKGKK